MITGITPPQPGSDAAQGRQSQPDSKGSGGIAAFPGLGLHFLTVSGFVQFAEFPS
jgi:hypothetical protein